METLGTVLVHEPDPEVRRKIRAVLGPGKVVFTSESGVLDFASEPPVALVVDVDRPGFEAALKIQCLHRLPIVVISEKATHPSEALSPRDVGLLRERLEALLEEHLALRAFRHDFV